MPAIKVLRNGIELALVNVDQFDVVVVNLHGMVTENAFSFLDLTGGVYSKGVLSRHLIWLDSVEIQIDDLIEVHFVDSISMDTRGFTIDELYDNQDDRQGEEEATREAYNYLAEIPRVRTGYKIIVETSTGTINRFETDESDWSYHCSVMWQFLRPDTMKLSLSFNDLESIRTQQNSRKYIRQTIYQNNYITVRFDC